MQKGQLSNAKKAGWIVWWIEFAFLILGGIVWDYIAGHPAVLGAKWQSYQVVVNVLVGLVALWHVFIQVLAYVAVDRLSKNDNYLWPIILIVIGFMGDYLYLIPGIWGLISNGNHRVDRAHFAS